MASNTIQFKNPNTGETRKAPVGYSWTVLFFSCIPPLFRSDWRYAVMIFMITVGTNYASWTMFGVLGALILEWGVATLLGFFYNKLYIEKLVEEGFYALGVDHGVLTEVVNKLDASITIPILEEPQANQKSQEPEPKKENSVEEYNKKKEKLLEEL